MIYIVKFALILNVLKTIGVVNRMAKPSGGILLAAWVLVIIGAILMIVLGALSFVGIGIGVFPDTLGALGALIGAAVSIIIGILIIVLRVADQLDEWVWIILALILGIIVLDLGGLLVIIGAILAIIAKVT